MAAQLSDNQYKLGQALTPDETTALVADNADTQAALDAQAAGANADIAYNKGFVGRAVLSGVGQVSAAAAQGAGAAFGPWKWVLIVGALVLVVVAGGYAYVLTKQADAAGKVLS